MYGPTVSSEIKKNMEADKFTRNVFCGVFAADALPKTIVRKPSAYVVNCDTSDLNGSHWVAIFVDGDDKVEFFDSYGVPPLSKYHVNFLNTISKHWVYNKTCLQSMTSSVCGHYCCLYIGARCRNISLRNFISRFFPHDKFSNDAIAVLAYKKYFNFKSGRGKTMNEREMSCCPKCACADI